MAELINSTNFNDYAFFSGCTFTYLEASTPK